MEISNKHVMLAYADYIVVIDEIKEKVINGTSKLINANKRMWKHVNERKTKYIIESIYKYLQRNIDSIAVGYY